MKRIAIVAIFFSAVLAAASAQQTIKVGYFENQPWVIPQEGKDPTGAAVDFWQTVIAPSMKVKTQWVGPLPMARMLDDLQKGNLDAVLILGKNPEREKLFLYPKTSYLGMRVGLALLKENPLQAVKTTQDLEGMRIGYVQGAMIPDFVKSDKIVIDNISTTNWEQDDFVKMMNKRVDAVMNLNVESLIFQAGKAGYTDKFKFLMLPVQPSLIYTVFTNSARGSSLLKLYEEAVVKDPKAMDSLIKKYIVVK